MSADSLKAPRAGPKGARERHSGPTSIANRGEPLFTSRHKSLELYEEPNFITDSLNTSFNASPSPARPIRAGKPHKGAGNVQGQNTGTSRAHRRANRSQIPTSPISSHRPVPRKHTLLRTGASERPTPSRAATSPAMLDQQNRARTPSPHDIHRDPLISPISNASESSPPRGLAESYRRIEDEELIAAQHGYGSDEDIHSTDDPASQILRDIINGELPKHLLSPTPSSRRSSRRFSPQAAVNAQADEKATAPSSQVEPKPRDSSPFEEITQEDQGMNRNLKVNERDQQRISAALASGAKPFRKARRSNKLGDSLDAAPRGDALSRSESASISSRTSSHASDPAVKIPAGWGRKARPSRAWLDRIKSNESEAEAQMNEQESAGHNHPIKSEVIADWVKTASGDSQDTTGSDSFKPDETEDLARPIDINSSPNEGYDSRPVFRKEISSTAADIGPAANGDVVHDNGAAVDGLDLVPPTKSTAPTNSITVAVVDRSVDDPQGNSRHNTKSALTLAHILGKDASKTTVGSTGRSDELRVEKPMVGVDSQVPTSRAILASSSDFERDKDHSRDLLRSLARATSTSPGPSPETGFRPSENMRNADTKTKEGTWLKGKVAQLFGQDRVGSSSKLSRPTMEVVETPQAAKTKADLKTPLITGAWVDTPATSTVPKPLPADVSTSNATKIHTSSSNTAVPETKTDDIADLGKTAPILRTALADIVARARNDRIRHAEGNQADDTFQLDDSTIESLEELIASSDNSGTIPFSTRAVTGTSRIVGDGPLAPEDKADSGSKSELPPSSSYSHLASRLNRLRTSISDAKDGVGSLQRRLSHSRERHRKANEPQCTEEGELHDFIVPCEKCGWGGGAPGDASDTIVPWAEWQTLHVPIPRLWTWKSTSRWVPSPTRAGWYAAALILLLCTELVASSVYSPPFYAGRIIGNGVDIRHPRPPFVIPQLLWQHVFGPCVKMIVDIVLLVGRIVCTITGFETALFDFPESDGSWYNWAFEYLGEVEDAAVYWAKWKPPPHLVAEIERMRALKAGRDPGAEVEAARTISGWFGGGAGWFGVATSAASAWENELMDADEFL